MSFAERPITFVHVLPSFPITHQSLHYFTIHQTKSHKTIQAQHGKTSLQRMLYIQNDIDISYDKRTKSPSDKSPKNAEENDIIWQEETIIAILNVILSRRSSCIIALLIESAWLISWLYFILLIEPYNQCIPYHTMEGDIEALHMGSHRRCLLAAIAPPAAENAIHAYFYQFIPYNAYKTIQRSIKF